MTFYLLMREAAFIRHKLLVDWMYRPGPAREAAHAWHREFVRFVYGF